MKPIAIILSACSFLLALSSCRHSAPNYIYMPDMVYSPAFKAQKPGPMGLPGSMRMPVKGTVPRNYVPYAFAADPEAAGRELKNPLRPTRQILARGQAMFMTYCVVCHGPNGITGGYIVPKFPQPPSLNSDKVRGWPDGRIYHVISMGQNLMPSYASQINPEDRWAIIHYVRVLQEVQAPRVASNLKAISNKQ